MWKFGEVKVHVECVVSPGRGGGGGGGGGAVFCPPTQSGTSHNDKGFGG